MSSFPLVVISKIVCIVIETPHMDLKGGDSRSPEHGLVQFWLNNSTINDRDYLTQISWPWPTFTRYWICTYMYSFEKNNEKVMFVKIGRLVFFFFLYFFFFITDFLKKPRWARLSSRYKPPVVEHSILICFLTTLTGLEWTA